MNDNELRDKVRRVITKHQASSPNGGTASMAWCDCSCGHQETTRGGDRDLVKARIEIHQAQAIIDDLGLTVEDRNDCSESRTAPDGSIVYGVKYRVVGKWEEA